MFQTGQQIGLYTLIKRLGRGGFGEVWLAERRAKFVTTKVAVKLPLDEQVDHDAIQHEAVLWEQASGHPNVLPIIDADEYDGQVVIVSEYAPDGSLDDLLQKENALPIRKAIELTIGILSGLEFLHSRKIIHRDIKPQNILLQGETPRLADFGISRVMKTTSVSMHLSGTPHYMAPEAFDRKRTVQTDIWSVGVILYQMLKGSLPFPFSELTDLLGAIIMREPELLPDNIPPPLQKIVFKALSKSSDERYQTAQEMRSVLADFLISISQSSIQPTFKQDSKPEKATELFKIEKKTKKTEVLPTNPIAETQISPVIPKTVFAANTDEQRTDYNRRAAETSKLSGFESHTSESNTRYLKIIAPFVLLILLVIGALYLYINKQSEQRSVLDTSTNNANKPLSKTGGTSSVNLPKNLWNAVPLPGAVSDANACILNLTENQDVLLRGEKITKEEILYKLTKCLEGKAPDQRAIYINGDGDLNYGKITDTLQTIRKVDVDKANLLVSKTAETQPNSSFEIKIAAEPKNNGSTKPNPLILVVMLNPDGKIQLNGELQNSPENLTARLTGVFEQRKSNGVFREGTNQIEKEVTIKAPTSAKYMDILKILDAVQASGAAPIVLN